MILILTSPAAAGKSSISNRLGEIVPNVAIIDVDQLRAMVRNLHLAPWEGKAGREQQILGVQNACLLAKSFAAQNLHVVMSDVLTNETAQIYREAFSDLDHAIVLLMPSLETSLKRNRERGQWISDQEVELLYGWQESLQTFDERISNDDLSIEEIATHLMESFFTRA